MNYFKVKENGVLQTFSSGLLAAVTLTALTACATDQIESRPPTTTDSHWRKLRKNLSPDDKLAEVLSHPGF